jgi:hypothetical protein
MDKIIKLFILKLESIEKEYTAKVTFLKEWELDFRLPNEMKSKDISEKYNFLIDNF